MNDRRLYIPRCNVHHALGEPMPLEQCVRVCEIHRRKHPNHHTSWMPSMMRIQVKGTTS